MKVNGLIFCMIVACSSLFLRGLHDEFGDDKDRVIVELWREDYIRMVDHVEGEGMQLLTFVNPTTTNPFEIVQDIHIDYFGNVIVSGFFRSCGYPNHDTGEFEYYYLSPMQKSMGLFIFNGGGETVKEKDEYAYPTTTESVESFKYRSSKSLQIDTSCYREQITIFREISKNNGEHKSIKYHSPMCHVIIAGDFEMINAQHQTIHNLAIYSPSSTRWNGLDFPKDEIIYKMKNFFGYLAYFSSKDKSSGAIYIVTIGRKIKYHPDTEEMHDYYETTSTRKKLGEINWDGHDVEDISETVLAIYSTKDYLFVIGNFNASVHDFNGEDRMCSKICVFSRETINGTSRTEWVISSSMTPHFDNIPLYDRRMVDCVFTFTSEASNTNFPKIILLYEHRFDIVQFTKNPYFQIIRESHNFTHYLKSWGNIEPQQIVQSDLDEEKYLISYTDEAGDNNCAAFQVDKNEIDSTNQYCKGKDKHVHQIFTRPAPLLLVENFPNTGTIPVNTHLVVHSAQRYNMLYYAICQYSFSNASFAGKVIPQNSTVQKLGSNQLLCIIGENFSIDYPPDQFELIVFSRMNDMVFKIPLYYYGISGETVNHIVGVKKERVLTPYGIAIGVTTLYVVLAAAVILLLLICCFLLPCQSGAVNKVRDCVFQFVYDKFSTEDADARNELLESQKKEIIEKLKKKKRKLWKKKKKYGYYLMDEEDEKLVDSLEGYISTDVQRKKCRYEMKNLSKVLNKRKNDEREYCKLSKRKRRKLRKKKRKMDKKKSEVQKQAEKWLSIRFNEREEVDFSSSAKKKVRRGKEKGEYDVDENNFSSIDCVDSVEKKESKDIIASEETRSALDENLEEIRKKNQELLESFKIDIDESSVDSVEKKESKDILASEETKSAFDENLEEIRKKNQELLESMKIGIDESSTLSLSTTSSNEETESGDIFNFDAGSESSSSSSFEDTDSEDMMMRRKNTTSWDNLEEGGENIESKNGKSNSHELDESEGETYKVDDYDYDNEEDKEGEEEEEGEYYEEEEEGEYYEEEGEFEDASSYSREEDEIIGNSKQKFRIEITDEEVERELMKNDSQESIISVLVLLFCVILYCVTLIYSFENLWNIFGINNIYNTEFNEEMIGDLKNIKLGITYPKDEWTTNHEFFGSFVTSGFHSFELPNSVDYFKIILPIRTNVQNGRSSVLLTEGVEKLNFASASNSVDVTFGKMVENVYILRLQFEWIKLQSTSDGVWNKVTTLLQEALPIFGTPSETVFKYILRFKRASVMERVLDLKKTNKDRIIEISLSPTLKFKRYDGLNYGAVLLLALSLLGSTLAIRLPLTKIIGLLNLVIRKKLGFESALSLLLGFLLWSLGLIQFVLALEGTWSFRNGWVLNCLFSIICLWYTIFMFLWKADFFDSWRDIQCCCPCWYVKCLIEPFFVSFKYCIMFPCFSVYVISILIVLVYSISSFTTLCVFWGFFVSMMTTIVDRTSERMATIGIVASKPVMISFFCCDTLCYLFLLFLGLSWWLLCVRTVRMRWKYKKLYKENCCCYPLNWCWKKKRVKKPPKLTMENNGREKKSTEMVELGKLQNSEEKDNLDESEIIGDRKEIIGDRKETEIIDISDFKSIDEL